MTPVPLVLQWGRDRYMIKYDYDDLRDTTLGQFKEVCREVTGVPTNAMKLIFSGATMKDNASPLAYYGVYPGAAIKLIGRKEGAEKNGPVTQEEREESAVIHKIDDLANEAADRLSSRMQAYLADAQLYIEQFSASATHGVSDAAFEEIKTAERKKLHDAYVYLNEALMQYLLKLDGIECLPEAEKARQRRRQAVRLLQSWMDQLDHKRESVKQSEVTISQ
ncbi:hypothetical protein LPJ62_003587 [Coemansia sp. RSA 2167]|nr:hypothetical protein LPJ58_001593 [Coemansia sp. RSA 1591]KAJ1786948.1 hypothetical protein LPJ62_003587 [Coemansia sp. RSA 2167]KAJ1792558.1 hypothetical protein LPJ67_001517 [Coemansia sp. RSA 1938]KAJ2150455.1 hypothetical protein J3F82_003966 [Coemansia sp. RSA 637]KAJ2168022.1 hypothetical protein GGH15_001716 [Coemansia sp. RSA 562]KAJ2204876.1 hypothetical protein IW145_003145 [Coemansia sp. RSA 521]KAJ2271968.1 hypothetical protein GGH14_004781 [Coemansia sp. RSA 370]KAJ2272369.1 